jgi:hypothetical protein
MICTLNACFNVLQLNNEAERPEKSSYFQHRGDIIKEPSQCSLVHAFNNATGGALVVPVDMYNARIDLLKVAAKEKFDIYLGTDEKGIGDWPIVVLMCVLGYNFYQRSVTLKKVHFGGGKGLNVILEAIKAHAASGFDLIAELQFPLTPPVHHSDTISSSSSSNGRGTQPEAAEYWRDLPVNDLGERGHFVAVRNGRVYDSYAPAGERPVAIEAYRGWAYLHRLYRVQVASHGSGDGGGTAAERRAEESNLQGQAAQRPAATQSAEGEQPTAHDNDGKEASALQSSAKVAVSAAPILSQPAPEHGYSYDSANGQSSPLSAQSGPRGCTSVGQGQESVGALEGARRSDPPTEAPPTGGVGPGAPVAAQSGSVGPVAPKKPLRRMTRGNRPEGSQKRFAAWQERTRAARELAASGAAPVGTGSDPSVQGPAEPGHAVSQHRGAPASGSRTDDAGDASGGYNYKYRDRDAEEEHWDRDGGDMYW